ncbi:MAG: hypothetical protein HY925_07210 [Elusimicrobia bacterium]|nr:hypothetical protein [Elusimicrobiota bacterium]
MIKFVRLIGYAASAYFFFRVGFPDEGAAGLYHTLTVPILLGGAVGVAILLKAIDLGSKGLALAIELGFAGAVFLYLGFTLPQAKGNPPLLQLASGEVPNKAKAKQGLKKLGLDPDAAIGSVLVSIFPD